MAWVNQLANDPAFANSIEWQRVQEEHKKWAESQTSLGPVAAIVVSVVVGMAVGPVAAQAGTGASGAAASAGLGTTISAGVGSAVQIGVTALASQAAVSFVNNDGDIGKVLKEMGSSESIKNLATAMVTAGVLQGVSDVLPENLANATNGSAKFSDQLQRQLIDGAAKAVVRSAINGTSLEDELRAGLTGALLNTVAAQSAYGIGGLKDSGDINAFTQNVLHAIAGCAVGAVRADKASGCGAGALGAVIGELTASTLGRDEYGNVLPGAVEMTQVLAVIAGAVAGLDANGIYIAAASSANAAINNALSMRGSTKLKSDLRACSSGTDKSCDVDKLREEMTRDTDKQTARIKSACSSSGSLDNCTALANSANLTLNNLIEASFYANTPEKRALMDDLISRQLTDMSEMYEALAKQQASAGFADLLRTAIAGALPMVGPGVGSMLGTKLGGAKSNVVQVPSTPDGQSNQNAASGAGNGPTAAAGVIASRVNVRTGDANTTGSGIEYAWKKHGGAWGPNKSAFTISKDELKIALQDPLVVNTPAYQSPTSGNFIRTVDMGYPIGIDAKTGGQPTSFMTVITDSKGNLINTFPGKTF
ncbi:DUF637 domain-containing protein, partial [Variovorax boronicumulans]|uniref:DUF637 domain-containing protein n=1 Tax=Variovorax boronicumulans TaxID=436515 RepID=UPI0033970C64